jgi:uncharacterized protein involved in exopolysaccharide biosynthesis
MPMRENRRYEIDVQDSRDEEGLDAERLRELFGLVARAPLRRPLLALFVFVAVAALGIFAAVAMPRTYNAEAKLLAQNDLIVPALSNPNRTVPRDADDPTRVANMIVSHDNLIELAKETDLVSRYYASRSPVLKLKDRLLGGAKNDEDRLRAVVGTLEKEFTVSTTNNIVTIQVDWSDAQMAYDLVSAVQKKLLEAHYDDDVAMIKDAIALLEQHADVDMKEVDLALADYQKTATEVMPAAPPIAATAAATVAVRSRFVHVGGARPTVPTERATVPSPDLTAALKAKRAEVRDLEAARQQRLDAVHNQLAQTELTLTPQHPAVLALQHKLDALSAPDPAIARAREEEQDLLSRLAPPTPTASTPAPGRVVQVVQETPAAAPAAAPSPAVATILPGGGGGAPWDVDARTQYSHAKLEAAIHRYQDATALIDHANIELEVARTAFKYRYAVVSPAEVPRSTKKPIVPLVGAGSVLGAILLAFLVAAMADRAGGRIFEPWQVQRRLDLEVLGECELPRLPAERS